MSDEVLGAPERRFSLPKIELSERTRTILRRFFGYPFFFLFAFVTSAYWTFPYDRLREFITMQVGRAIPGAELEIVSLEPSFFSGLGAELEGVTLRLPPENEGERPYSVTLPRVWAGIGMFSYLFGTTSLSFEIEIDGGGYIEGSIDDDGESTHVVTSLTEVDLRRIGPLRTVTHLPITGIVTGEIDVTLAEETADTEGAVTLRLENAAVGDGRARIPVPGMSRGLTVERLALGDVNITFDIEHGSARLTELRGNGEDAEIRGEGSIRLSRQIRMWALDLLLRVNILPAYRERNAATQAIFSFAEMTPEVRPYRAADGAFQFRIHGTIGGHPVAAPAGSTTISD